MVVKCITGSLINKTWKRDICFSFRWRLTPSINISKLYEPQILKEIINKHPEVEKEKLIAYGQHYGFPTRAIDFTSDLKAALYFACKEYYEDDGAIYITGYSPHQNNWISSLTINLISQMDEDILNDVDLADRLMHNEIYERMYCERSKEKDIRFVCAEFSSYINDGFMAVYDFASEKINKRIRLQKGSLFYCGSKYYIKNKHCSNAECSTVEFPKYQIHLHEIKNPTWINSLCVKVRIPKELKKDIVVMTGYDEILGL